MYISTLTTVSIQIIITAMLSYLRTEVFLYTDYVQRVQVFCGQSRQ
jgi:hypothetical protein